MFYKDKKLIYKISSLLFGLILVTLSIFSFVNPIKVEAAGNFNLDNCRSAAYLDFAANRDIGPCTSDDGKVLYSCVITENNPLVGRKGQCAYEVKGATSDCVITKGQNFTIINSDKCKKQFEQVCASAWDKPQYEWEMRGQCRSVFGKKPEAVTVGLNTDSFTKDTCKAITDDELKTIQKTIKTAKTKEEFCKGLNNEIYKCGAAQADGKRDNCVPVNDAAKSTGLVGDAKTSTSADEGGIFAWIANIVLGLLTLLLWLAVQFAKFALGVMGGMFVVLVSVNPASNELLNVAKAPWQAVVNIANILLISGIIFMGFDYILNLDFIKKSQGLQNFFLGLLTVGVMMQFTFAASAGVVNFTNGIGNIIYFGAGGIAQPSVADPKSDLGKCLDRIKGTGDLGIGFVNTFVCSVSQVSPILAAAEGGGDGLAKVFENIQGKGASNFVTTGIALAIFVLAIFSFWKVLIILLVRIFGLWMLIVLSPLALVAAFSPLPQMKDMSTKWLDNFMRLSFSYPFYTLGITLVTLMIGSVSTALQEGAKKSGLVSLTDGSIDTYAQGATGVGAAVGNIAGGAVKFDSSLIVLIIIALFSLGLVAGFGILFTKMFGAFYDAVANAVKSGVNFVKTAPGNIAKKADDFGVNKAVGAIGGLKIPFTKGQSIASVTAGGKNRIQQGALSVGAFAASSLGMKKSAETLKDKASKAGERARDARNTAENFRNSFTFKGSLDSTTGKVKRFFNQNKLENEQKQKEQEYREKIEREAMLRQTPEGRKQAALEGLTSLADIDPEAYKTPQDYAKALKKKGEKKFEEFKATQAGYKPSSDGDLRRKKAERAAEELKAMEDAGISDPKKEEELRRYLDDAINGPGGLGELQDDLFIQGILKRKDFFASLSEESQKKFLGDENSFGQYAHLLDDDVLQSEILAKGGNQKALKELNQRTLGSGKFQGMMEKTFGGDYLSNAVGKDALKSAGYAAGMVVPFQIEDQVKSRLKSDSGLSPDQVSRAATMASGLSRKMGTNLPGHIEDFIKANKNDPSKVVRNSKTGRYDLTVDSYKTIKADTEKHLFGAQATLSSEAELNDFLANTELGQELAEDSTFEALKRVKKDASGRDMLDASGQPIFEYDVDARQSYANAIRDSYKAAYKSDSNDHVINHNIEAAGVQIGANMDFEDQSKAALADYAAAADSFGAAFKADATIDRGSQLAAKEMFKDGKVEEAQTLMAMASLTTDITALAASNDPRRAQAQAFLDATKTLETVDPSQRTKKLAEITTLANDLISSSSGAFKTKVDSGKDNMLKEAGKASAHIEAEYLHKEVDKLTGIKYQLPGSATEVEFSKADLAKLKQSKAELAADANEYLAKRNAGLSHADAMSGINSRLTKKKAGAAAMAKYDNLLQATAEGKINGRNQGVNSRGVNERHERALKHLGGAVGSAANINAVGSVMGEKKNAAEEFTRSRVADFTKNSTGQASFNSNL